jgi:hypothetical protein
MSKLENIMPTSEELAEIAMIAKLSNMPLLIRTEPSDNRMYKGFFWLTNAIGERVYPPYNNDMIAVGYGLRELRIIRYFLERMMT